MQFSRLLERWPVALACALALAGAVLLPGLGGFGVWEPHERQAADRLAPRADVAPPRGEPATQVVPSAPVEAGACQRTSPPAPAARSLPGRAMAWGRAELGDSATGRRRPLALLGLLTVVAAAGVTMRLAGARAGVLTALVLVSMPLLVFQSRQLLSEIGTAAGASLTLYGLVALAAPARRGATTAVIDGVVALAALTAGLVLGFLGGGALLGVLVPLGAFAAAHGLGLDLLATLGRGARLLATRAARGLRGRWAVGALPASPPLDRPLRAQIVAFAATATALVLAGKLAYQLYSWIEPQPWAAPPQRAVLGQAIVASGCWSPLLGALWRPEDDLRYSFDSTFEQIAYGTYPWGIVAPIAIAALLASGDVRRRTLAALSLAWAGGAWIASEAFQRKVGFTLWAGFPALAIAIGAWLDGLLAHVGRGDDASREGGARGAFPPGAALIGLFVALAVVNLGKDLQSFTERITSLLVGGDQIAYPKPSRLLLVPTRVWALALGVIVAGGFAVTLCAWREDARARARRSAARIGAAVALAGTAALAAFWAFAWLPRLSLHLSSKAMFDSYRELRRPGDALVVMGDLGDAPRAYAPDATPETVTTREQLVTALGRASRVFAIAPQTELCQLHHDLGGKPYYVLDDRNTRSILLSNRVEGATDRNPLRAAILHEAPARIASRPKGRVVFDNKIELVGWDMPRAVGRGDRFQVKMFYKVLQPIGGNWRILFHFDGALRFNGDHEPIERRCQTASWQPGDYIVDTHTVTAGAGAFTPGRYEVWTGFFTGSAPNWKNMAVSEAPPELRDAADRVKITTIELR